MDKDLSRGEKLLGKVLINVHGVCFGSERSWLRKTADLLTNSLGHKVLSQSFSIPNPNTIATIAKITDSSWFKKSLPKSVRTKEEQQKLDDDDYNGTKLKPTETLNEFHIISLSEGFDLSPLFEEKKREEKEELRFATTRPASSVISKLEEVAKVGKFTLKKMEIWG